jgi:predicted esterase
MPNLRSQVLFVETSTHGRVLYCDGAESSAGLVVAFHGYGHCAGDVLASVQQIPGIDHWRVAAPEALHRFYTRDQQKVVGSWMTREDRDLAIADNLAYVARVIDRIGPGSAPIVFVGFSQGASMAYRAAVLGAHRARGVIALGGDIPPEVRAQTETASGAAAWPAVLVGAGVRDTWFADRVDADLAFLAAHAIPHEVVRFDGAHEWTPEFSTAAGRWLGVLAGRSADRPA